MPKQQSKTTSKFKTFSKYDFVKSFIATNDKEEKAAIIADAIEDTQRVLLENLVTKQDLKNLEVDLKKDIKNLEVDLKKDIKNLEVDLRKDMKILEINLKKEMQGQLIKLGSLIVILFTILPLLTDFLKKLF